jgi:phosphoglycolate phosphatase-like HAD superfamily hydrolase
MRAVVFDLDHTLFAAQQQLHDGVLDLLIIMRRLGFKIGALTSGDHRAIVRLEEAAILCADQSLVPKSQSGFHHMVTTMGVKAEQTLFVSHAHADILLGKDAGVHRTIGVSHDKTNIAPLVEAGADHIVHDIPTILDVLE